MELRTVAFDGTTTLYLEGGVPSATTVVLVHDGGYGSDALTCWEPILPSLTRRFRVLAPDLLGFGGTSKLVSFDENPLSHRLGHLSAFCRELDLERPALIGSSFGGALVLNAAARRALTLCCGVSICGTGGLHMVGERFTPLQDYSPSVDAAHRIESEMVPDPDPEHVRSRYERSLRAGHWEALTATRVRNPLAQPDEEWLTAYLRALGTIDVPILLIAGAEDRLLEPGWQVELAAIIPGGQTLVVAGARHQPHRSHPAEVSSALVAFLDDVA
jgi:pimeloyl-ACP methyl ester carboxylesterase